MKHPMVLGFLAGIAALFLFTQCTEAGSYNPALEDPTVVPGWDPVAVQMITNPCTSWLGILPCHEERGYAHSGGSGNAVLPQSKKPKRSKPSTPPSPPEEETPDRPQCGGDTNGDRD